MRILSIAFLTFCVSNIFAQEVSGSKVLDRENMDFTVKPGDDFQQYANGVWLQKNPVPAKETRWGSFSILYDFNVKAVRVILNDAQADKTAAEGSIKKRVGDFYASAMDSALIEKQGFTPVKGDYDRAGRVKTTADVLNEIVYQYTHDIGNPLFSFFVGQDRKRPTVMAVLLGQGGTSMPDRDYYLKSDARSKKAQAAFDTYVTTLFKLAGAPEDQAKQNANSIFELEKKLAAAQLARVLMRDPQRTYNKFALSDFGKKTPNVDWTHVFANLQVGKPDSVIVNNPAFFASVDSVLTSTPPATLGSVPAMEYIKGHSSLS